MTKDNKVEKIEFEFTDRYKALGIPYPDLETMCKGQCEGTGWIPVRLDFHPGRDELEPELKKLWEEAEAEEPSEDGYHFVKCPDCKGTGKR